MTRYAARIDENQPGIVAALIRAGCCVQSLAALGCGVPDLLVWSPHTKQHHLIEVKNPEQDKSHRALKPDQVKFHTFWKGPIAIVETAEQALAAVGIGTAP